MRWVRFERALGTCSPWESEGWFAAGGGSNIGWKKTFPDLGVATIYQYVRLARNREFLESISSAVGTPNIKEAIRLIQHNERVRRAPQVRDAVASNLSANITRRHLSKGQGGRGKKGKAAEISGFSQRQGAIITK